MYLKTLQLHSAKELAAPCWTVMILARRRLWLCLRVMGSVRGHGYTRLIPARGDWKQHDGWRSVRSFTGTGKAAPSVCPTNICTSSQSAFVKHSLILD